MKIPPTRLDMEETVPRQRDCPLLPVVTEDSKVIQNGSHRLF